MRVVRRGTVIGVLRSQMVNYYLAQLHIPDLGTTSYGEFAAVNLSAIGHSNRVLIGRDILKDFTMFYNGRAGEVTISND